MTTKLLLKSILKPKDMKANEIPYRKIKPNEEIKFMLGYQLNDEEPEAIFESGILGYTEHYYPTLKNLVKLLEDNNIEGSIQIITDEDGLNAYFNGSGKKYSEFISALSKFNIKGLHAKESGTEAKYKLFKQEIFSKFDNPSPRPKP